MSSCPCECDSLPAPRIHSFLLFPTGPADSSYLHTSATKITYVPESPSHSVSFRPPSPRVQTALHLKTAEKKSGSEIENPVCRAFGLPKSTAAFSCCYDTGDPVELPA